MIKSVTMIGLLKYADKSRRKMKSVTPLISKPNHKYKAIAFALKNKLKKSPMTRRQENTKTKP